MINYPEKTQKISGKQHIQRFAKTLGMQSDSVNKKKKV